MVGGRHLARRCAVQALYQWQVTGQKSSEIQDSFIHNDQLTGKHLDYFTTLVTEVPDAIDSLDRQMIPFLDRDADSVDLIEQAILRIGTYELIHQRDIPAKVIIDEAVDLAKTFGSENGYKYVNGVLDKVATEVRGGDES